MRHRLVLAAGCACALAWPLLAIAATPVTAPATHAATPATRGYDRTVLQDARGHAIDRAAFAAALRGGQRYVSRVDTATGEMRMQLLPPGVATPDSFAPTDLKTLRFTWIERNGHHYSVEFHGVHGQRIDRAAFTANAAHGQRYREVLDAKSGAAILTLLPLGVHPAGSKPTTVWAAKRATAHVAS